MTIPIYTLYRAIFPHFFCLISKDHKEIKGKKIEETNKILWPEDTTQFSLLPLLWK